MVYRLSSYLCLRLHSLVLDVLGEHFKTKRDLPLQRIFGYVCALSPSLLRNVSPLHPAPEKQLEFGMVFIPCKHSRLGIPAQLWFWFGVGTYGSYLGYGGDP